MPLTTYVLRDGKLVDKRDLPPERVARSLVPFPMISVFTPYQSIIDGTEIRDMGAHKRHLAANNCEEIGSETPAWIREAQYVQRHGGTYERPAPDPADSEGVTFEWLDPVD